MIEQILQWDQEIFVYLNHFGQKHFDGFWIFFTNQKNWIPLYLFVAIAYFKYLGWKKALSALAVIGIFLAICDQSTNFIKAYFHRLRPSEDPFLEGKIRELLHPNNHSFISGHASNSTVFVWFSIFLIKKYSPWIFTLLLWWMLFMYSRIYVGVHYPLDIVFGILWGFLLVIPAKLLYQKLAKKMQDTE